jgi:protein-disulfide isomerase
MSKRATYAVVGAIAVVIAGALIAVSVLGSGGDEPAPSVTVSGSDTVALLTGIPERGPVLGRQDAPVTLVEFADLQCPFCAEWSQSAFPEIVRDYVRPGKVRIVFRGLSFLGPDSEKALRFAVAAGLQGRLWYAVDLLYANQGQENSGWVTDGFLAGVAAAIPVFSPEQAHADETSPQVDAQIRAANDVAAALDVRSTPSFAAGKTGGELTLVSVTSLTADALRPTLDSLLAK